MPADPTRPRRDRSRRPVPAPTPRARLPPGARALPQRRRTPAAGADRAARPAVGGRRRQARPGGRRRRRHPHLRRSHRRVGRPPGDPARRHHRPDRAQRRRQDHAVQPADRVRPARHRHLVLRRPVDWARLSPHQVARLGVVRTFQLTKALSRLTVLQNMLLGAQGQRGESFLRALIPGTWQGAGEGEHREGDGPARSGSSSTPRRTTSPARSPAVSASCWRWRGH